MKNLLRLLLLLGLSSSVILSGCSVRVYGVPKDEWQRMSPAEQQQARAAYQERMRLYEERRLYEAKQRAHEAELKAQKAREEASRQTTQKNAHAPALIHLSLEKGTIYIAGRHHAFQPVTVELRDGESKHLQLITADERKPHHVQLVCSYEEGVLKLSNGKSRVHAQKFPYDKQWHHGRHYQNLTLGGGVGLRGGVMRVASGPSPALSPSHSLSNHGRGENSHDSHRSEPRHPDKQPPVAAIQKNNGKAPPAPKGDASGNDRTPGASISAIVKEKAGRGGKEEAGKPDHAPGKSDKSRGQSQATSQSQGKSPNANGSKKPNKKKEDDAQQEALHVDEGASEDEQACAEAKGNKDKRADCSNRPVVSKFNPKN